MGLWLLAGKSRGVGLDLCGDGGGDVGAELFAFEVDEVGGGVRAFACFVHCGRCGGDGEDAPAVGVEVALGALCASVVNLDGLELFGGFDT